MIATELSNFLDRSQCHLEHLDLGNTNYIYAYAMHLLEHPSVGPSLKSIHLYGGGFTTLINEPLTWVPGQRQILPVLEHIEWSIRRDWTIEAWNHEETMQIYIDMIRSRRPWLKKVDWRKTMPSELNQICGKLEELVEESRILGIPFEFNHQ